MPFHLAVALDGTGWHPSSWRTARARPSEIFDAPYWVDLVVEAERGLLDFVTLDDSLELQSARRGVPDERVDQVRGRLDAVLVAARVAPMTTSIGILPVATTTHTEPFHVSKAIATLDFVTSGRAGVQIRVGGTEIEVAQFGRRRVVSPSPSMPDDSVATEARHELFEEAADFVEVMRRLWDSWEDDAEIRDVATGRFVDREKLHYIDFAGRWFSVRGPSITPRPPQGQPIVAALVHRTVPFHLAARSADVAFVTPQSRDDLSRIVSEVRAAERAVGRDGPPLRIFADLAVFLDRDPSSATARRARFDTELGEAWRTDAFVFAGTPDDLAELLTEWHHSEVAGFRLRPAALPDDLESVAHDLVPILQDKGLFHSAYTSANMRDRLGLSRPPNRYATIPAGGA